jgi:hypothetical protein
MAKVYCAGCGDRLRLTTVVLRGVARADLSRVEWRHTTRRWDNRYRPDTVTRSDIFRRFAVAMARSVRAGANPQFWAGYYSIK